MTEIAEYKVRLEKSTAKVSLPYHVLLNNQAIALCPSEWCGMTIVKAILAYVKLQEENERLRAEAKLGNISYKEAIAIKEENEKLKAELERVKKAYGERWITPKPR